MPERASMPAQPSSTARATTSSHTSPAATRTIAPPHWSADSTLMPDVATRTTVPEKPSSATTTLEPPESTSRGSSASSTSRTASTSSSVVSAVTRRAAGPPTRIVVRSASGTSCSSRMESSAARSVQGHDGERPAEHLVAAAGRGQLDGGTLGLLVDRLDDARDLDVGPAVMGHDDGPGEAHAVVDHPAGITDPVADHVDRGAHGEHAVGDDGGQPDGPGEALVPVDRVAVEAGAGVADQRGPVDVHGARGQLVADVH